MNLLSIKCVCLLFVVQSGCASIWIPRHGPLCDQGNIYSGATSPTGSVVAVVGRYGRSSYGRLSIYNTKTGREIGSRLWPPGRFLNVTFDPSGTMLAASDRAGNMTLWQLRESAKSEKNRLSLVARWATCKASAFGPPDWIMPTYDLAFSPDGSLLALACTDPVVRLFDVATRKIVAALHGHESPISAVAFSHDGLRLASAGSTDGTVNIWDVERRTLLLSLRRGVADVTDVAFPPNANWVVVSYGARFFSFSPQPSLTMEYPDEQVRIWDAASGKLIRSFRVGGDRVNSVSLSPDGQRIAAGYFKDLIGHLFDDSSPGIVVLIDAVPEAHEPSFTRFNPFNEVGNAVRAADISKHAQDGLIGSAMQRSVKGSNGGSGSRIRVGS